MSFIALLSKALILEGSDSRKLNRKKVDRGGGLPWLFENYREVTNAAVMRHGGDKQTVCLIRQTNVQTARPSFKNCLTLPKSVKLYCFVLGLLLKLCKENNDLNGG